MSEFFKKRASSIPAATPDLSSAPRVLAPSVLAVSTNDGLAAGAANLGLLLNRKHYYFVPFRQDDPLGKPTSLVADYALLPETLEAALAGRQLQPLLLPPG